MSVKLIVGEKPHQMLRFEPDAFMSDDAPEEDQCLRVQFAAGMRQCIELSRLAKMNAPNGILRHTRPLLCLARHAGALGTHLPTEERKELLLLVVGSLLLMSLNLCSSYTTIFTDVQGLKPRKTRLTTDSNRVACGGFTCQ